MINFHMYPELIASPLLPNFFFFFTLSFDLFFRKRRLILYVEMWLPLD